MADIGSNVESSGRALYHRWCGSETTDEARYYDLMNPAERDRWEALGRELDQQDIGHNAAIQGRIQAITERDALSARVEALEAENKRLRALYENVTVNRERFGFTINHLLECEEALRCVEERAEALEAQRYEALKALDAAIEVAVDMRPYVPDYFAKKWHHDEELAAVTEARRILTEGHE
jgi:hypothetical protein